MNKKIVLLLLTMIIVIIGVSVFAKKFTDLDEEHWAYKYVTELSNQGIIDGYEDGSFRPNGIVTHAEFIKLVITECIEKNLDLSGLKSSLNNWSKNYVQIAENYDVIEKGKYNDDNLNRPISRLEMVTILAIADRNMLKNVPETNNSVTFSDISNLSETQMYDLRYIYNDGLIIGYEDNTFKPSNTMTRAETATVIYRLHCKNIDVKKVDKVSPVNKSGDEKEELKYVPEKDENKKDVSDSQGSSTRSSSKKANPSVISGIESIIYDGESKQLVVTENVVGTVYYSLKNELTSKNYKKEGTTEIPEAKKKGEYTIYYYIPAYGKYKAAQGTFNTNIIENQEIESGEEERDILVEQIICENPIQIRIGNTITLDVDVSPSDATNKKVTFTSLDKDIFTVDKRGKIKPIKEGAGTLEITSNDGNATKTITVEVLPSIKLKDVLEIGDYIEYDSPNRPYTLKKEHSGAVDDQLIPVDNICWRVWNISGDDVYIMPMSPLNTNNVIMGDVEDTGVNFKGALGYVNAPTCIDDICKKLYSSSYYGVTEDDVRSFTIEDLESASNVLESSYHSVDNYYDENNSYPQLNLGDIVDYDENALGERKFYTSLPVGEEPTEDPEFEISSGDNIVTRETTAYEGNYYGMGSASNTDIQEVQGYPLYICDLMAQDYYNQYAYAASTGDVCYDGKVVSSIFNIGIEYSYNLVVYQSNGVETNVKSGLRPIVRLDGNLNLIDSPSRNGVSKGTAFKIQPQDDAFYGDVIVEYLENGKVKITVNPLDGYELDTIKVTNMDDEILDFSDQNDGVYLSDNEISSSIDVEVVFKSKKDTISFNANGGECDVDSIAIYEYKKWIVECEKEEEETIYCYNLEYKDLVSSYEDEKIVLPNATKEESTLIGWFNDAYNSTTCFGIGNEEIELPIPTNKLRAKWGKYPSVANAPILKEGMTPVNFPQFNSVEELDSYGEAELKSNGVEADGYSYLADDGNYYGSNNIYTRSRMANAKTEDGSIWVWIPRFAYKITYYQNGNNSPVVEDFTNYYTIDVLFMYETSNTHYRNTDGEPEELPEGFIVHPAFQAMNEEDLANGNPYGKWSEELEGFWVAKYPTRAEQRSKTGSWSNTNPGNTLTTNAGYESPTFEIRMISKSNGSRWTNINIDTAYTNSLNMYKEYNSHLMKNSEWGAITYLLYSQYGYNNNMPEGGSYLNYNGVYDLMGNLYEMTASYLDIEYVSSPYSTKPLVDEFNSAGKYVYDNVDGVIESNSPLDLRNKQVYPSVDNNQLNNYRLSKDIKGGALYEVTDNNMRGYNYNYSYYPSANSPFFLRNYYNSGYSSKGLFTFSNSNGKAASNNGFRPVLAFGREDDSQEMSEYINYSLTLYVDADPTYIADIINDEIEGYTITVDDTSIAEVDENGNVIPKAIGDTIIHLVNEDTNSHLQVSLSVITDKISYMLSIGDWIEYSPNYASYSLPKEISGSVNDATIYTNNYADNQYVRWRVWDISGDKVTIIPGHPLNSGGISTQGIFLLDAETYVNGPNLLDDMCKKLYKNSSLGVTEDDIRSIRISDLEEKSNLASTYTSNNGNTVTYGSSAAGDRKFYNTLAPGEGIVDTIVPNIASDDNPITETTRNYSSTSMVWNSINDNMNYGNLLSSYGAYSDMYFIANTGVSANTDLALYSITILIGDMQIYQRPLCDSTGRRYLYDNDEVNTGLMPIITLSGDLKIDRTYANKDGKSYENAWRLIAN